MTSFSVELVGIGFTIEAALQKQRLNTNMKQRFLKELRHRHQGRGVA